MSASTTSLPSTPVPSITTTTTISGPDTGSSPIARALSKAKRKKSAQNLGIQDNQSSLSLSSNENGSVKSSTSVIDKIRKRRADRKERKEAAAEANSLGDSSGLPNSRRNSVTDSFGSGASAEATEPDGISVIYEPGLVAAEPGSHASASTPTFPISISTSFEDPSLSARGTQLQITSDGRPVRRSTSPGHSSSSRDGSPGPTGAQTPTLASGILIANILALKGKSRSDSTTSNTSGSGADEASAIPRTVPNLQLIPTTSTAMSTNATLTLTRPDTVVTPPTPIEPAVSAATTIITRRARGSSVSKLPSKLSQSSYPEEGTKPLTPMIEVPTPQQTPTTGTASGNAATGFFSNMFSAAQTAASQLSNTIANTSLAPNNKAKKGEVTSINSALPNGTEDIPSQPNTPSKVNLLSEDKERKPLAVETLGQGELSLGSLGIVTGDSGSRDRSRRNTAGIEMPEPALLHGLGLTGEKDEEIGQIPKSAGGVLQDKSFETIIYEKSAGTPSQTQVADEIGGTPIGRQRSDSGRSILGRHGSRKRRDRGASATTQGSDTPIPIIRASTTFAAASHRRNKDFHTQFKSIPLDDHLIEDYGCALQKEILFQGRMYVSNGHICFHSNIFGWVTTLVISFDEIVAIERKNTALVIPNAIMIQTLHARNVFASFISRDSTYDLILGIWRTIHPNLIDTVNGTRLGDEKDEGISEEPEDEDGSEYGSDDDYDSVADDSEDSEAPPMASETPAMAKSVSKKASTPAVGSTAPTAGTVNGSADAGTGHTDFPGPAIHMPTVCGDETAHLDRALCDETIAAPLGKTFAVLYGNDSYPFLTRLLAEDCKVEQLAIPNEAKFGDSAEYPGKKARSFSYVKPLNASIGPKSTKCLITEVVEQEDMEKAVTVVTYTQTPDVPSGGVFKVLTRTCLMWGEGNGTRIIMTCTVEWSGKSWIKGPIEKGASDGQINYTKELLGALRREFAGRLKSVSTVGGKGKRKRREGRDAALGAARAAAAPTPLAAANRAQRWGILGPVMDPVTSLVGDFGAGILVTLVLVMFAVSAGRAIWGDSTDAYGLRRSERGVLQELWMREEAGLWDWLEDRAGVPEMLGPDERVGARYQKEARRMKDGIHAQGHGLDPSMVERQVNEAIRVTEERLGVLKRVNEEKRTKKKGTGAGCGCSGGGGDKSASSAAAGTSAGGCGCGCQSAGGVCGCKNCACQAARSGDGKLGL